MHGLYTQGFGDAGNINMACAYPTWRLFIFNLRVLIVAMTCNLASLLFCLNIAYAVSSKDILSVYKTGENRGEYILHEDILEGHVVWGSFEDDISSDG